MVNKIPSKEHLIIMGDFNAKIGEGTLHPSCGKFGLGESNAKGEKLLDWLDDNALIALNTCFKHRTREKYTWTSPNGRHKNMIDFLIMRRRDRRECLDARALPSADCGSDHQLIWTKIRWRQWNTRTTKKIRKKWRLQNLTNTEKRESFENNLKREIGDANSITWSEAVKAYTTALDKECPKQRSTDQPWMDERCFELIEMRKEKKRKEDQGPEYRELCKEVKKECRRVKRRFMESLAEEAEEAARQNNSKKVYKLIKKLTGKRSPPSLGIKDAQGELLLDKADILSRWHQYASELFQSPDQQTNSEPPEKGTVEPSVMEEEIRTAIRRLQNEKASG